MIRLVLKNRSLFEINREKTAERLSRHYPLNKKTRSFQIALRYDKASDLFDANVDPHGMPPRISDDITDQLARMLDDIPEGYSVDFIFTVDDFEDYTSEQIMDGINDALYFRHLRYRRQTTRKGIKTGALLVVGILLILILNIGKQIGWWGGEGDNISEILIYLLDTFGCVLIWEGLYNAFVEEPEELSFERTMSRKISSISLYDENEDKALATESSRSISAIYTGGEENAAAAAGGKRHVYTVMMKNQEKKITRGLLLVSGFSLIGLGLASVMDDCQTLIMNHGAAPGGIGLFILDIVAGLGTVAAGALSLHAYRTRLKRIYLGPLFAIAILYFIYKLLSALIREGKNILSTEMILGVFIVIAGVSFVIGYWMYAVQWRHAAVSKDRK